LEISWFRRFGTGVKAVLHCSSQETVFEMDMRRMGVFLIRKENHRFK
jgi:hypothetical protein